VTYLGDTHSCENALRFFQQVFINNTELIDYALRLFGYSMTGHIDDKSFYILWGEGNNGKTTLIDLLECILQNFYNDCDTKLFLKEDHSKGRDVATPSMMRLKGRRLVSCAEIEDGKVLDEPQIKKLTGGDTISGRELYKSLESFKCKAKLVMLTNSAPSYNTLETAMQIRIKLLPFLAFFGDKIDEKNPNHFKKDTKFIRDLKTIHLSEVFTLLVRGARKWYESGLAYPEICDLELKKQNNNNDYLQQFIDSMCICVEGTKEKTSDFHKAYKLWSEGFRFPIISIKNVKIHMKEKGFEVYKSGSDYYKGLMLNPIKK
jgi:putative DNA primase/helicase